MTINMQVLWVVGLAVTAIVLIRVARPIFEAELAALVKNKNGAFIYFCFFASVTAITWFIWSVFGELFQHNDTWIFILFMVNSLLVGIGFIARGIQSPFKF